MLQVTATNAVGNMPAAPLVLWGPVLAVWPPMLIGVRWHAQLGLGLGLGSNDPTLDNSGT